MQETIHATGNAPTNPKRRILRMTIWIASVLILMTAAFVTGRMTHGLNGLPAIAATLPGNESQFSRELNDRIRERFPVGTSEDSLIAYLTAEKFTPEWRRGDEPNASTFVWNGLLCKKIIRIYWRADTAGALTDVNGSYESRCL
jgi:hypothetical protein